MHVGDIKSFDIKKNNAGSFIRIFPREELEFLGFSEKDLERGELSIVIQADYSKKHSQNFLGFAKRR